VKFNDIFLAQRYIVDKIIMKIRSLHFFT